MILRAKSLVVVVTLLCISLFDTNFNFAQFHSDTENTVKYSLEEGEKKFKDKKVQNYEQSDGLFRFNIFTNTKTNYVYEQKIYSFKIFTTPFRPPLAS